MLKTIPTIQEFRKWRKGITGSIGFIPTMGALHDGHLSLVEESIGTCQNTIVSIYLNPAQFAPGEDLSRYPKTIDTDIKKLSYFQIDCVFLPNDSEMYPKEFSTQIQENILSRVLEGNSRPGFFTGVTTIVAKLFNIIEPTHVFFGEKDAQQLRIVEKLVTDLNYPIQIISCPIIREENGLAMSSRNEYFNNGERIIAATIQQALKEGKNLIISGERSSKIIRKKIIHRISSEKLLTIDYVSVADSKTLIEISDKIKEDVLVSVAVYLGEIRLIDNFSYSVSSWKSKIH